MKDFLHHLFVPRESNNHRASLLHHQTLLLYIFVFVVGQFILSAVRAYQPQVLGTTTDISTPVLLQLTNQKRQQEGLGALSMNDELAQAASAKANYMFAKNFWAHNGPDGTTPWVFIKNSGYQYLYAGENLARGFSTSSDVVEAWMNSPTHRQNILSPNYKDIGFSVKEGKLLGEDTVLVVEMFGSTNIAPVAQEQKSQSLGASVPSVAVQRAPAINGFKFTWNITTIILVLFIVVLTVDMIVVERKKIVRLVGHNVDHILFLSMLLIFVIFFVEGVIL